MDEPIYKPAFSPDDLFRLFVERLNDGDVDGLLLLYETDAVMVTASGNIARDRESIRELFEFMVYAMVMQSMVFSSIPFPTLQRDNLVLISSRLQITYTQPNNQLITQQGFTSHVANRQPNGIWLFIMSQIALDPFSLH